MSKLDELFGAVDAALDVDLDDVIEGEVEKPKASISPNKLPAPPPVEIDMHPPADLSEEFELIANAMLATRGNLAKASRLDTVPYNAMQLRNVVKSNPEIRKRYHDLLADELQEKGLHISERILKMAELQEKAMGCTQIIDGEPIEIPADPKMVIELSKEISRLIAEGRGQNVSAKSAVVLASKEDAKEILAKMLNS